MRLQLALNVDDLETAVDHYTKMFDTEPHKVRDGYANFAIAEPPLKLVLFENPDAVQHLNHIGVEMFGSETIEKTSRRFEKAGILKEAQLDTVCCHAGQDKVWTAEDSDLSWEWYVINDDAPEVAADDKAAECCGGEEAVCC